MERVETFVRPNSIEIEIHAGRDTDIEQWHALRTADTAIPRSVRKSPGSPYRQVILKVDWFEESSNGTLFYFVTVMLNLVER